MDDKKRAREEEEKKENGSNKKQKTENDIKKLIKESIEKNVSVSKLFWILSFKLFFILYINNIVKNKKLIICNLKFRKRKKFL